MPPFPVNTQKLVFSIAAGLIAVSSAQAQYKWVGPDGQVNYGDRPPSIEAQKLRSGVGAGKPLEANAGQAGDLPFATRNAAAKSPVVLYAAADCNLCNQARSLLVSRGIPFTEKQIRAKADLDAYKQAGFADGSVPGLTVGSQRTQGFEAGAWQGLLDSAGYPKSARLPEAYKNPQPVSLASGKPALEGAAAVQAAAAEKLAQENANREKQAQAKAKQDKLQAERSRSQAIAAANDPGRFKF